MGIGIGIGIGPWGVSTFTITCGAEIRGCVKTETSDTENGVKFMNSRITHREVPLRMKELLCLEGLEGCRLLLGDRRGGRVHRRRRRTHLSAGNPAAHFDFIRRGALAAVDSKRKMLLKLLRE